jgi:alpha-1,3-rhamnosyl/mannosyltransferase
MTSGAESPQSPVLVGLDLGALMFSNRSPGTAKMVREQAAELVKMRPEWRWQLAVPEGIPVPFEIPPHCDVHQIRGRKYSLFATFRCGRLWEQTGCSAAFAPAGIAPVCRIPVLSTYFDSSILEHGWTWRASGRASDLLILRVLAWHTLRVSDAVLTNSEYCRRQICRIKPSCASKVHVNYCGISPLPPPGPKPDWATTLHSRPFMLNAGSFSENKNQRRLIEAWGALQRAYPDSPHLVLIGPCDERYRQSVILPSIHRLSEPERIVLAGHISETDLSWAFHNAVGYVQPSIAEGFSSFSVHQAMQCRLPVACSNTTSHPEAVGNAALFFDPFDVGDIARAVSRILRDQSLRKELVDNAGERVGHLTWEANARVVVEHLQRMIGR